MNQYQTAIADLIKLATTKKFPGNQIINDMEANTELWIAFYGTLHNCTIPGTFGVYDTEGYNVAAENLRQLSTDKPNYNKLVIYSTGKNNIILEEIAHKNWGCKYHYYQSGLIRGEINYHIQILIFHWY